MRNIHDDTCITFQHAVWVSRGFLDSRIAVRKQQAPIGDASLLSVYENSVGFISEVDGGVNDSVAGMCMKRMCLYGMQIVMSSAATCCAVKPPHCCNTIIQQTTPIAKAQAA